MSIKPILRTEARARRADLARAVPDFAARIAAHAAALEIPDGSLVAAYVAMGDEADPQLLLKALALRGCIFAFPRVVEKARPLAFHRAMPGGELVRSAFGVPEPAPDWPIAHPKIFLVPLLAFDARGTRLGYGGGFYDRTLAATPGARAIGVAYAGQEMPALPRMDYDRPLDAVVTENGIRRFHQT
ncbi:MAG TPA: 5-formyltetrahydrofolate cyclo-ligase [Rhizomicrobium sp.]|jgi:5-formyltetrahydrofolate cyclo-ligase|nr:5-formyltetrahydrofolate cyclo-ligase [Rhizomicrobium sp.]